MAAHEGLINRSFYFGVGQESQGSVVLGRGGAAFCVHRALQGKYGEAFAVPDHGAVTPAALLKVIKGEKNINTLGPVPRIEACWLYFQ